MVTWCSSTLGAVVGAGGVIYAHVEIVGLLLFCNLFFLLRRSYDLLNFLANSTKLVEGGFRVIHAHNFIFGSCGCWKSDLRVSWDCGFATS